jgi:hypothetical protein
MEIAVESDIYVPGIDDNGNYIDKIPSFAIAKYGIRCPCGSRKNKVYTNASMFSTHIKTKCHKAWLSSVNTNKANYYLENETLKITVQNQRLIIAKMEKDLQNKMMTIDYLTLQITQQNKPKIVNDLLDFD